MRKAMIALAFLAGCSGESVHPPDEPMGVPGPEGTELDINPALLEVQTSELGTERLRPVAKTLDVPVEGTNEGDTYLGRAVVVDRVLRDDAQNRYGVRVRLKNTTKKPVTVSWLIRFHNRSGAQIAGYTGQIGDRERWQTTVITPFDMTVVHDSALITGAEGFRLLVRAPDGREPGTPD